ncbi:fungal-specific transcription factor domain-containing protein [Aspergillus karnatakaensis]|uniref:fungal specific transcription factor domain-containing protein n=1 Tax=Aspergillus karnatakaensis TaxID=1810916 RepID=UPI003CCDD197
MSVSTPTRTPPRRSVARTRISRACLACQQKKQKVHSVTAGLHLATTALEQIEVICIVQDPSTKRRHPRGYLETLEQHNASLENHVAFLEQRLKELRPDADLDLLQRVSPSNMDGSHYENCSSDSPIVEDLDAVGGPSTSTSHDRVINSEDNTVDDLGLLCLRSAGADPHYFGASSAYSFTKIFSASLRAIRRQAPGLSMTGVADSFVQSRPTPSPAPLPARSFTTMLTSAYFDQIHPQFPFLHRPTYMRWEEEVLEACERGYAPEPTKAFFVYALSAVGALTGPLAGGSLPEGLYASAENLFEHVLKLNTLESIQAILCCAMYSIRSPVGASVWLLSGLALRQCTELGLHRKMMWDRINPDILKTQIRRRVFWCCYNLDRAISITLGRPQGITDGDIDIELPLDIDDAHLTTTGILCEPRTRPTDSSTTMSAAIHTIRLRRIWARIQTSVYPQVNKENSPTPSSIITGFVQELNTWLESSPAQLASNESHNNAFGSREWFEAIYHHSILLLYRYNLVSRHQRPCAATFLACAQSGAALCTGYRQFYVSNRLTDTWAGLHNLFLGGVTFIYCLWSSADARAQYRLDSVSNICTACTMVLSVMAERWSSAGPYRNAFEMLANATMAMLVDTTTASSEPSFPILRSPANDQFEGYFAHMAEVGMGGSLEALLSTMLDSQ